MQCRIDFKHSGWFPPDTLLNKVSLDVGSCLTTGVGVVIFGWLGWITFKPFQGFSPTGADPGISFGGGNSFGWAPPEADRG